MESLAPRGRSGPSFRVAIRLALPGAVLLGFIAAACQPAPPPRAAAADPAAVEAAYEDFEAAWEAEDLDGVIAMFRPDAVAFDPVPPGKFEGTEGIRSWAGGAFEFLDGITITSDEIRVRVEGPVAWVTAHYVFEGRQPDGELLRDEGNLSMVWVLESDGRYRATVFHASNLPEEEAAAEA